MSNIGDPVTQPVPAVGTAGTSYATQLVALLTEIKSRIAAKVPISSVLIGLLDMANNAISNLSYLSLYQRSSAPTTPTGSLQNYAGNLWYVSTSGAIQLTSGSTINAAAVKGLGGDYGSPNPASLDFVDADQAYYFKDDAVTGAWGYTFQRGVDIAAGATSANRVRLKYATAASYDITLPAVPASQLAMQMASTGVVTVSNTFVSAITAPDYKISTARTKYIPGSAAQAMVGSGNTFNGGGWSFGVSTETVVFPIPLTESDQINAWVCYINKTSNATCTVTAGLYAVDAINGTATLIGSAQTNSANNPGNIQLTVTGLTTNVSGPMVIVVTPGGLTGDSARGASVTYKRV